MNNNKNEPALRNIGTDLGIGLIAGLSRTFAMNNCQKIDMKITGSEGKPNSRKCCSRSVGYQTRF
ncbi:MAG: hypothetical protein ABI184_02125 [Ginsengibacter sp.]